MVEYLLDNPFFQIIAIVLSIVLVALIASLVTFNFRKSLSFLISVDTFAGSSEELDRKGFSTGLTLTIMGMLIFGALISVLNNAFMKQLDESRLTKIHRKIDGAFEMSSYHNRARIFLRKHDMTSHSRGYTIEDLEFELEMSREDIIASINLLQGFRVRQVFGTTPYIAVEKLNSNKSFGTLEDKQKPITLIATSPLSVRYLGHFSYVLAENIPANYLSNDFFDGGHLDNTRRRSFTVHEDNLQLASPEHSAHQDFFHSLSTLNEQTALFVYNGYSESDGSRIDISCATIKAVSKAEDVCSDIPNFSTHFARFKETAKAVGVSVALDLDKMKDIHLSLNVHRNFQKPVLNIYPSVDYYGIISEPKYYRRMKVVLDFVRAVSNELQNETQPAPNSTIKPQ